MASIPTTLSDLLDDGVARSEGFFTFLIDIPDGCCEDHDVFYGDELTPVGRREVANVLAPAWESALTGSATFASDLLSGVLQGNDAAGYPALDDGLDVLTHFEVLGAPSATDMLEPLVDAISREHEGWAVLAPQGPSSFELSVRPEGSDPDDEDPEFETKHVRCVTREEARSWAAALLA